MFKFNFDLEEEDNEKSESPILDPREYSLSSAVVSSETLATEHCLSEIPLSNLLDTVPSRISFSPLSIPLSSGREVLLARRDLFDARFQLISAGGEYETERDNDGISGHTKHTETSSALDFLDAPSDLVPGVYEGGLKTWECSLDLVDYLDRIQLTDRFGDIGGKRVLEVGCGTAVPTLYLLHELFSSGPPAKPDRETQIHLQDFNSSVLELVTLPNILLAWYKSSSYPSEDASSDFTTPGELTITPSLKEAFLTALQAHGLVLRFFTGSWDSFNLTQTDTKYDVVLTSETIYRTDSLHSLVNLLSRACGYGIPTPDPALLDLGDLAESKLSLNPRPSPSGASTSLCLVSAKVLYFGVGGGVSEFVQVAEKPMKNGKARGKVETVWEHNVGVGRRVMKVEWVTDA